MNNENSSVDDLLSKLKEYRLINGGFNTSVCQPQNNHHHIWVEEMHNTFVPANVLLPLTLINTKAAKDIIVEEYSCLSANRNSRGLWHYFVDSNAPYFIPYETDTNSLLSYISVCLGEKPLKKKYFYQQISKDEYFNLWFRPKFKLFFSNPFYFFSLFKIWNRAHKYLAFKNNVVSKDDAEFCVSANILLYLGENIRTKKIVLKLLSDVRSNSPIKLIYYPFQVIALYLFARAYFYGKIDAFENVKHLLIEKLEIEYYNEIGNCRYLNILTANVYLFFNIKNLFSQKVIDKCFELYDYIEEPFPFYCSNIDSDINPETNLPNAYFGSKALTISFYLEFLFLLKLRNIKT